MSKVQLVRIVANEEEPYWATLDLDLPFVPFPGLQLAFDADGWDEIREVTWEVPAQRLVAALDPWDAPGSPWEGKLAWLQRRGWQIEQEPTDLTPGGE
jgi:hypothetical protein